ncbi:MAG: hypothetical protein OQL08_03720 [Gammaproteobacteria bacterium]|nr:hypothetical protein [Gammaproteobacteria bacterium]
MNQEQQHLLYAQLTTTLVKLERDIERHRGARRYHMRRTNIMVKVGVIFLLIMAVFNVLYLVDFYTRMQVIVSTITTLGTEVTAVSQNMVHLAGTMEKFDAHVGHMPAINESVVSMGERMPALNKAMEQILGSARVINYETAAMRADAVEINRRFGSVTQGINLMGSNVNAIAGPMGSLNSFMP